MKKAALTAVALAVLALAGVFAPVSSVYGCTYRCPTFMSTTDPQWGLGVTCAEAESNAIANAQFWAESRCNVCRYGAVTIVTSCMPKEDMPGTYRVDASIEYACEIERCFEPEPI